MTVVTGSAGERVTNERDLDHSGGAGANCKSMATEKHERPQKIARPNPNYPLSRCPSGGPGTR